MSACDWHASLPPRHADAELAGLLRAHWGLEGQLRRLRGERDLNVRLTTGAGARFLLKVAHPDTRPDRLDVENRVLADLAAHGDAFRVPGLVRTNSGDIQVPVPGAGPARLLTWLAGEPLDPAGASPESVQRLGEAAARLNDALEDIDRRRGRKRSGAGGGAPSGDMGQDDAAPVALPDLDRALPRDLPWDLRNLPDLANLLETAPTGASTRRIRIEIEHFERDVAPALAGLPEQIVHNDLNPDNLLLASDRASLPVGIIDFGDMVRAPVVCDLAIMLAYLVDEGHDPLQRPACALRAFHRRRPLAPEAVEMLPALVRGRLRQTQLIQGSRLGTDRPGSPALANTVREAGARLDALDRLGEARCARRLADACRPAHGA